LRTLHRIFVARLCAARERRRHGRHPTKVAGLAEGVCRVVIAPQIELEGVRESQLESPIGISRSPLADPHATRRLFTLRTELVPLL